MFGLEAARPHVYEASGLGAAIDAAVGEIERHGVFEIRPALKAAFGTADSEALQKFSGLALWGIIYYIAGQPAGFIIGEALTDDTFCLHFAKASKKYHGIYEYMFNNTANRLKPEYKYLNLEEDMGNKNLRRTKSSYGPEFLLKKYRVGIK